MLSRNAKVIATLAICIALGAVCAWWVLRPKELTLADFQSSSVQPDPFWQSLQTSGLDPDDWVRLAAATDDCRLGISAQEINSMMSVIDRMLQTASGPKGAYLMLLLSLGRDYSPPEDAAKLLDLQSQSREWALIWNSSSKTIREYECGKLMRKVEQIRNVRG